VQHTDKSDLTLINKGKVFVIGLDGATFDLITPWTDEGKLPNLAKMMREGAYGELSSTIPTNSAPAWTSFVTGTNPGKHGILHFKSLGYQTEEYLMNRKSRGCKAIWNILSEKGKKVGVINVPLTYPPENVNGFMISGMDTPSRKKTFTFPAGLYKEIKEAVGDYQIEAQLADLVRMRNKRDRQRFIQAVMNTMELRFKATKFLMEKYDWDFFFVVFTAADRFQHRFWKFMDKIHPHYDSKDAGKYGDVIFNVYKRMDDIVGELSERLDDNTTLIIMSDHGFGAAPVKYINLNSWLASNRLLFFKDKEYGIKDNNLLPLILNKLQSYTPLKLRHYLRDKFRSQVDKLQLALRSHGIDWSVTIAYADQHVEIFSTIWINLKGREPHGIVEPGNEYEKLRNRIIALLKDLKDPEYNETMVENIYKREDIFTGKNQNKTPDIIVKWKNDAYRTQSLFNSLKNSKDEFFGVIDQRETNETISGEHKHNGIFLIKGKDIKEGLKFTGARIIDLAPTILHLMGLSVSREIDGVVLKNAFKECRRKNIIKEDESILLDNSGETPFTEEEQTKVKERLRGLGYLD